MKPHIEMLGGCAIWHRALDSEGNISLIRSMHFECDQAQQFFNLALFAYRPS